MLIRSVFEVHELNATTIGENRRKLALHTILLSKKNAIFPPKIGENRQK
jgi:hypothetical protein